uniref:Uncharacterized protein n=1 Tax=Strigamia maritima TaxID=126957 RepID=T1JIW3_STRMM
MKIEGQLKVEQTSIPRVHRIHQPPKTLNILNKIVVPKTQVEKLATRMASAESIGSCSLDVDATASESSGTADGITSTASQRTLLSASLANRNEERTGEVEKIIVKMPEEKFVTLLYVPEVNGTDEGENGKEDEIEIDAAASGSRRQPSYVNISCSVSGYTSYACYNSKVREGLRSRDASPARTVFSNENSNGDTQRVQLTNGFGPYNGDMKNARSGSAAELPLQRDEKKSKSERALSQLDSNLEQPKSLVQQRIERLYGPGALAQGFLIRAKARNLYGGVTTTSPSTKKSTTSAMNGTGKLNHEVSSMLEGKPVGKLVAAVLASPSLLPRSVTSSPVVSSAWKAESIAQATASFSSSG